jgi:hypothetical protein
MRHCKSLVLGLLFSATAPLALIAQLEPASAHTNLYFPQLADGGTPAQQWQTTFTFLNTNTDPAAVVLTIFGNNGSPLRMDFGAGPASTLSFAISGGGTRQFRSTIASQTIQTGWAVATASLPLQAVLTFRELVNGVPKVEISTEPTLPAFRHFSPATRFTGIAMANIYGSPVSVNVQVNDADGNSLGQQSLTIPGGNHLAFNLWQKFPNLDPNFHGSLILDGNAPPSDSFIAWTLNADASGVLSSLPPGRIGWPISHWDQIWFVFWKIWDATQQLSANAPSIGTFGSTPPQLKIDQSQVINAFASGGNTLQINLALSELISDSPSELAFAVAHEMGHIYQQRNNGTQLFNTDIEFDADQWGAILSLIAGYDPYASAGALAKLAMATGSAGLASQFEAQLAPDAHKSFNTRLENVYATLSTLCSVIPNTCALYKGIFHPNFPASAPLSLPPVNPSKR